MVRTSPPQDEVSQWPLPCLGSGTTRLLGIFGDPVAHSLSPVIHNFSLNLLGLDYRYLPFHVAPSRLYDALQGFRILGGTGFNATVPHKEALLPWMDELSPAAARIGAVNTVHLQDRMIGHNTDAHGFLAALREEYPQHPTGKVLVLGAGGAARSVLSALLDTDCSAIFLANRTEQRAMDLARFFAPFDPDRRIKPLPLAVDQLPWEEVSLLVNTTSLGLKGEATLPVALHRLAPDCLVYDIVYGPQGTPLTRLASRHNLHAMDGLGMLIHQAAAAFSLWTQHEMPIAAVKAHLLRAR
ncbi:MAG: shikimate dehydrogenase [Magnetococcales bacterium]|nr:shikimate dehydrogenase [Magnetococcales bacterium]MBF0148550.1 shikimate dehydrogenase [Magnetococcales bacterium]MBF0629756.1 shikimate dehydrogenase [Magnetococcales bacterium]